jgi:hypothetical protein
LHELAHQYAGGAAELGVRVSDDLGARQREEEGLGRADVGLGVALAITTSLPATSLPRWRSSSVAGSDKIATSAASPFPIRAAKAPTGP